jgi:hypothetical protein
MRNGDVIVETQCAKHARGFGKPGDTGRRLRQRRSEHRS